METKHPPLIDLKETATDLQERRVNYREVKAAYSILIKGTLNII